MTIPDDKVKSLCLEIQTKHSRAWATLRLPVDFVRAVTVDDREELGQEIANALGADYFYWSES